MMKYISDHSILTYLKLGFLKVLLLSEDFVTHFTKLESLQVKCIPFAKTEAKSERVVSNANSDSSHHISSCMLVTVFISC